MMFSLSPNTFIWLVAFKALECLFLEVVGDLKCLQFSEPIFKNLFYINHCGIFPTNQACILVKGFCQKLYVHFSGIEGAEQNCCVSESKC